MFWCMQLSNMSFTQYMTENIIKPANLTNMYYWIGGQGMEPRGIRKNVVSIPGYVTTFQGSEGGRSWLHPQHMNTQAHSCVETPSLSLLTAGQSCQRSPQAQAA